VSFVQNVRTFEKKIELALNGFTRLYFTTQYIMTDDNKKEHLAELKSESHLYLHFRYKRYISHI